jgi:hypothetical protein
MTRGGTLPDVRTKASIRRAIIVRTSATLKKRFRSGRRLSLYRVLNHQEVPPPIHIRVYEHLLQPDSLFPGSSCKWY